MVAIKFIQYINSAFVLCIMLPCLVGCALAPHLGSSKAEVETSHLVVRDRTGQLTDEQVRKIAEEADRSLREILTFWSEDPKINELGKIRIELERPRGQQGEFYGAVFKWGLEGGKKIRIVYLIGVDKKPQMMVHKLTHAIFPNDDKLIRNMMGMSMEVMFGNCLTFPMCGFNNDTWVAAFHRLNFYVSLAKLGPEHESWGMTTNKEGFPTLTDRRRQHISYAEAGSFGYFLLNTYGVENLKKFYRLSLERKRPWKDVFGLTLAELERNWARSLESNQERETDVAELMRLFETRPSYACFEAQALATQTGRNK